MGMDIKQYPPDWNEIARSIKDAAGWRCEWCGVEHGATRINLKGKPYRVILTCAHLNHTPSDCSMENLRALCSACHLRYDVHLHRFNARQTRFRRKLESGQLILKGVMNP